MKKFLTLFFILVSVIAVISCDNKQVSDSIHEFSLAAYVSGTPLSTVTTYELNGGQHRNVDIRTNIKELGRYDIKINYGVDESLVTSYNNENGTNYSLLPSSAYKFEPQQVIFDLYNANSPVSVLTLTAPELEVAASYILPVVITSVETPDPYIINSESSVFYFILDVLPIDEEGSGTKENPYKLWDAKDLCEIEDKLVEGTTIYFTVEQDIDMSELTNWVPINLDAPYSLSISLDGKGHTISNFSCKDITNPGFFGVLNGIVKNITFDNAYIKPKGKGSGIVAAWGGKGDAHAHIKNVRITNSTNETGQQMSGILCGLTSNCTIEQVYIENCNFIGGKPRFVGFIAGIDDTSSGCTGPTTIKNTYVKGGSVSGNQQVAGIYGRTCLGITIENCGVSATLIANDAACGGIIGQGSSSNQDKVTGCIVWCPEIKATSQPSGSHGDKYSSGIVIGSAKEGSTYTLNNCLYRSDIDFTDGRYPDYTFGASADINQSIIQGGTKLFRPWHGKPATVSTASLAAKALGWDEAIWDLTGDEPKLR